MLKTLLALVFGSLIFISDGGGSVLAATPGSDLQSVCPAPHESCAPECGQECTYWKCADPQNANISIDRLPFSYILQNNNCTDKHQQFSNYTRLPFTPAVPAGRPSPAPVSTLQPNPRVSLGTWACLQKWNGFYSSPTNDPGGGATNGGRCCTLTNYIDEDTGRSIPTGSVVSITASDAQRCKITCNTGFVRTGQNSSYPETTGNCQPKDCNDSGRWGYMSHNQSKTVYSTNLPAGPCSGVSKPIKCKYGEITGTGASQSSYPYVSCSSGCLTPEGTYIKHDDTVTAYSTSTPAGLCTDVAAIRRCSDGTLSNSGYSQASCTNGCTGQTLSWNVSGRSCSGATTNQSTGRSSTASVYGGQSYNSGSATFTCTAGTWGSAIIASCTIPWTVGGYGSCSARCGYDTVSGTETRSVFCRSPGNCTGDQPLTSQDCSISCPARPGWTTGDWGLCSGCNGSQSRTVSCSASDGICSGSIPDSSQSCGGACPTLPPTTSPPTTSPPATSPPTGGTGGRTSDGRLKRDIEPIQDAWAQIEKLQGVKYRWKNPEIYGYRTEMGFIAQEVEVVYPELVDIDPKTGLKSVHYDRMVAPLVEALKELRGEIRQLKKENLKLKQKLDQVEKKIP